MNLTSMNLYLKDYTVITAVAAVIAGIVCGLFGERLYKIFVYVSGFAAGYIGGRYAVSFIGKYTELTSTAELIICIVAGVIGFVLLWKIIKLGIFVSTGTIGFIVLYSFGADTKISLWAFAICGVLSLLLQKAIMRIVTSVAGGFGVAYGGCRLLEYFFAEDYDPKMTVGYAIWAVIFSIVFVCCQFGKKKRSGM